MLPHCPNKNKHHSKNQCLFSATYTSDGAKYVCKSRFYATATALHTTAIHSRPPPAVLKNYLYTETGESIRQRDDKHHQSPLQGVSSDK